MEIFQAKGKAAGYTHRQSWKRGRGRGLRGGGSERRAPRGAPRGRRLGWLLTRLRLSGNGVGGGRVMPIQTPLATAVPGLRTLGVFVVFLSSPTSAYLAGPRSRQPSRRLHRTRRVVVGRPVIVEVVE